MARYASYNRDFPLRPLGRDKDGRKRYGCRRCGKMVPKRCRSFCSDRCRVDVLVRCGTNVRHFVGERDRGQCARCGLSVPTLVKRLKTAANRFDKAFRTQERYPGEFDLAEPLHFRSAMYRPYFPNAIRNERWNRFLRKLGISPVDLDGKSLWEAHHKIAVKDGGGACGLDGLETLCRWCHKRETARQQEEWARDRKDAKEDLYPLFEREARR